MLLVWRGPSESTARATAMRDLAMLERQLAELDARLPDDGTVRLAFACAEIDEPADENDSEERRRLRELLGQLLASADEQPLGQRDGIATQSDFASGGS
jgi:hypothetical protein